MITGLNSLCVRICLLLAVINMLQIAVVVILVICLGRAHYMITDPPLNLSDIALYFLTIGMFIIVDL
jgi:hypothetical protein